MTDWRLLRKGRNPQAFETDILPGLIEMLPDMSLTDRNQMMVAGTYWCRYHIV